MKLTPEQLREIAERESLNTNEIRKAFIGQSRGNPENEEECAEEIVIYDLCKALDQNNTDIPRLLAHIAAVEGERVIPLAFDGVTPTYIEYKGYRYRIDNLHRTFKDELKGSDNSKEVSHE